MEKLDVLKQGRPLDCDLKVKLYYDILDDLQIAYQRLDLKDLSLNEESGYCLSRAKGEQPITPSPGGGMADALA